MKPATVLGLVVFVLLAVGALVMSGLFTGSEGSPSEPTKSVTKPDAEPPSKPVEAPEVTSRNPAKPDTVREVVRETAKDTNPDAAGTAAIAGSVKTTTGEGIADAEVTLYFGPKNSAFKNISVKRPTGITVKTDTQGDYVIENVAAASNYAVVANHPEYAEGERLGVAVSDGEYRIAPHIVLTKGSTLHGLVSSAATSAPIAGANVELWNMLATNFLDPSQRKPWRTTKSDAAGNYEFKNVHFTSFEIVASAEGHATLSRRETQIFLAAPLEGSREFKFELPLAMTIRGIAVDGRGTPIADVRLDAEQIGQLADRGGSRGNAMSAANGTFEIIGLQEGTYQLSAQRKGFSQKLAGQFPAGATDVRVQLDPRGVIRGTVTDSAGRPVTHFDLVLNLIRDGQRSPTNQSRSFDSPTGAFEFDDAEPGQCTLEATAQGFAPTESAPFMIDRDHATENVIIKMTVGGSIIGRAMNAKGEPIAGAEVSILDNDFTPSFISDLFAEIGPKRPARASKVRTGRDGAFEFQHLKPAKAQVEVKANGYTTVQKHDVEVIEAQATDVGMLTMSSGGEIQGRCVDQDNKPFSDGSVTASIVADASNQQAAAQAAASYRSIKPDYDGRFTLSNLTPGDWELQLTPEQVDGQPVNPLYQVMIAGQTKVTVPVRDGVTSEVTLKVPQMKK